MDPTKYHRLFIQEARKRLAELDRLLTESEREGPRDRLETEVLDNIHSLKGMAQTLQLDTISELCQSMERFCQTRDSHGRQPDSATRAILADGLSLTKLLVEQKGALTTDEETRRFAALLTRLNRVPKQAAGPPEQKPLCHGHIGFGEFVRPLSAILPRLCRQFGKEVRLEVRGGNLAISTETIKPYQGALAQLLKFCVVRSIEPPHERLAKGKSRQGQVILEATHTPGRTHIRILDDGCSATTRDRHGPDRKAANPKGIPKTSDKAACRTTNVDLTDQNEAIGDWRTFLEHISRDIDALGGSLTAVWDRPDGAEFKIELPAN